MHRRLVTWPFSVRVVYTTVPHETRLMPVVSVAGVVCVWQDVPHASPSPIREVSLGPIVDSAWSTCDGDIEGSLAAHSARKAYAELFGG